MIQAHHRYTIVHPSIHPENRPYRWIDEQSDEHLEGPPEPGELPELPWAWIEGLQVNKGPVATAATPDQVRTFIDTHTKQTAPQKLDRIRKALAGYEGARHDTLVTTACWALREAAAGWYPATEAIEVLHDWWKRVMDNPTRRDGSEFGQAAMWAVAQADLNPERIKDLSKQIHADTTAATAPANVNPETGEIIADPMKPDGSDELPTLADRVLTIKDLRELKPPEPLVPGLLDRNSLSVIYGIPGAGKTFVALDLALRIASGKRWHKNRTGTYGNVLYIAAEGAHGLPQRIDAWKETAGVPHDPDRFSVLPEPVNLLSPSDVAQLKLHVEDTQPVLLIVDTLARCLLGGDENSAKDMGQAVEALEQLRRASGACVLAIHHSGKDRSAGARGSSALLGAATTMLEVTQDSSVISIRQEKQKDHPEGNTVRLRLIPAGDSVALTLYDGVLSDTIAGKELEALTILASIETPEGVAFTTWRDASHESGIGKTTVARLRKKALEQGLIDHGTSSTERSPKWTLTDTGRSHLAGEPAPAESRHNA